MEYIQGVSLIRLPTPSLIFPQRRIKEGSTRCRFKGHPMDHFGPKFQFSAKCPSAHFSKRCFYFLFYRPTKLAEFDFLFESVNDGILGTVV